MAEALGEVLGSVLQALPNPVFVKDEQHRWVLLNDSYCQFMGYPREQLLGNSDYDFFPREQADVFWSKDDLVFSTGGVSENEELFTDNAGREHVILTRKTLHVDPDGHRFLVGVITDISDRKHMEEDLRRSRDELERRVAERTAELNQLNAELREAHRRKDEFLGMLSHELRNPLAPLRNSTYILRHAAPGSEQAQRAQSVIERQTEHMTRLVDDLLDVTRIARGKIDLRRSRVDLREVVGRTADDFRWIMRDRGVQFDVALPDEQLWADADATRITQIVGNLLHNASKFTRKGDEVALSLDAHAGSARIRVRDTGAGIDPDLLPRIFDAFVQGERTLARTDGGLGLGLALVKGIAELHGGSVRAESVGNAKGSQFTVLLPLLATPDAEERVERRDRTKTGCRVLVVDDNHDAAESLADIVRMLGHPVEVAYDGPTAIAKARANPPGVVLCDIGLSGMSGYEVAQELRRILGPEVQLIALSGYAQPDDVNKAVDAGFDTHVAKPADPEDIERLLSNDAAQPW